jgi:hypothetical protein
MKFKFIIPALALTAVLLGSCTGDHSSHTGKDTVINTYKTKDTSKIDTSKVISSDNSATGGAGNTKDTAKQH